MVVVVVGGGGRVENMAQDMRTLHELVVPVDSEQSQLPVFAVKYCSVNLMLQYTGKTIEQIKEPWKPSCWGWTSNWPAMLRTPLQARDSSFR